MFPFKRRKQSQAEIEEAQLDRIKYHQRLSDAPKRDVSRAEFEETAMFAQWKAEAVTVFLRNPLYSDYVLVGREGLRVIE